jgi:CRISPR type III-A-associated protein Csm2
MRDRPPPGRRDFPPGRQPYGPPPRPPAATLPEGYLKDGYFDSEGHLRPEVVGAVAQTVAQTIRSERIRGREQMAYSQLRGFWDAVRSIRKKLDAAGSFNAVRADIRKLCVLAANAVGREVAPPIFKLFIDRNVDEAVKDQRGFETGFFEHFQAVVGFYKYLEFADKRERRR